MAHEIPGKKLSGIAATALTQYTFVKAATGSAAPTYTTATTAASGVAPGYVGVVQNAPTTGAVAELTLDGVTKVKSAEAIVAGQYVTIGAGGTAAVAGSGAAAAGFATTTVTDADQLVSVLLLHGVTAP